MAVIDETKYYLLDRYNVLSQEIGWLVKQQCKSQLLEDLSKKLFLHVNGLIKLTSKLKIYILRTRHAREGLIEYSHKSIYAKYINIHKEFLLDDLGDSRSKINTILHLNRISHNYLSWHSQMTIWWAKTPIKSTYLQFESVVRAYRMYLSKTNDFYSLMVAASVNSPELGEPYLEKIEATKFFLDKRLKKMENRGFLYNLKRQRILAERRLFLSNSKFEQICLDGMQEYLDKSNDIETIEKYRIVEKLYMEKVKICIKKL